VSKATKRSLKDKVAITASIVAIFGSLLALGREYIFAQHVLRASVVHMDEADGKLRADILLVNSGKHYETLYEARFIFSDDLSLGAGSLSEEAVGPIALEPGKAAVVRLETNQPDIKALREDGTIKDPKSGIHLGVIFDALTPAGELRKDSKIFRLTELLFDGERRAGNRPRRGDNSGLIDLL
jgi:hypothetical protein